MELKTYLALNLNLYDNPPGYTCSTMNRISDKGESWQSPTPTRNPQKSKKYT